MAAFSSLALSAPLVRAVDVLGFTTMTPVQEHALPKVMRGDDVIAQARTGSGKTVAFGLGLLSRIDVGAGAPVQALVLCPTRELADQVSAELRKLARFIPNIHVVTLCGGVPVRTQTPALQTTPHIIVGTPGRILDHLQRKTIALSGLQVLVLDEADRMLDMGFADAITDVVAQTPAARQTLLFSATFPPEIKELSASFQKNAAAITVDTAPAEPEIEQVFYEVEPAAKLDALVTLLARHKPTAVLVFCHTKNDVREVTEQLSARGHAPLALHGDLDQRERDEVLLRFANRSAPILVATDVAARGLDIKDLPMVVAWELPTDPDIHVHRIGRTGRAGQKGLAVALVSRRERTRVAAIEARTRVVWGTLDKTATAAVTAAAMVTFVVDGGKDDKLRAGDVLGALTKDAGIPGDAVGQIDIGPRRTYVALRAEHAAPERMKIKGKTFRVRKLEAK